MEANPGLFSSFPWLSAIAQRFETYTFQKLSLEYVPMCGTSTSGVVMLAPDFDVSDWMPEDVIAISSYPGCVRSSLWSPCQMDCDPRNLQKMVKERYIREDDVPGVDMKLYDAACLYIFTYGGTAAARVGSIWASYDVVLRTPSMDTSVDDGDSARVIAGGTVTKLGLFGTAPIVANGNESEAIVERWDESHLKFKRPGKYLLNMIMAGTGFNFNAPAVLFNTAADGNETVLGGIVDVAATGAWYDTVVEILRPCVITLAAAAAWTTVTAMNLRIAPYKLN